MSVLSVNDLTIEINNFKILNKVSFSFEKGKFYSIIGPNGSGKTTLLRTVAGLLKPQMGQVLFENENINTMDSKKRAGLIAMLPQNAHIETTFTVQEIVEMGRYHKNSSVFRGLTKEDKLLVKKSMELVGVENLAKRSFSPLSGGEKQRVLLARALCQQPEILLLDEPTASLDINYQLEILKLLKDLNIDKKLTIITILHDIQLAAKFSEEMIFMNKGKIYTSGTPQDVVTSDTLKEVYNVRSNIHYDPFTKEMVIKTMDRYIELDDETKIHLIAGGGSGVNILELFGENNPNLSIGVVNEGDLDWKKAENLGINIVDIEPYGIITEESHTRNLELAFSADVVILCNTPFGNGNLKNLEAVKYAVEKKKKVLIIGDKEFSHRDYTENKVATMIFNDLINADNVFFVQNVQELWEQLKGGKN